MKQIFAWWLLANLAVVALLGFRGQVNANRPWMLLPDMDYQPKYTAQSRSAFFADGRAARHPVAGTVPFAGLDYDSDAGAPSLNPDFLQNDKAMYLGKNADGSWVPGNPLMAQLETPEERLEALRLGRELYEIYCAVCHGASGNGKGITTRYGMVGVATYHDPRILAMPDGEIYNTIANGKGIMMPYGHQIRPRDRWAVVAYIRALQLSRAGRVEATAAAEARENPNLNANVNDQPRASASDDPADAAKENTES